MEGYGYDTGAEQADPRFVTNARPPEYAPDAKLPAISSALSLANQRVVQASNLIGDFLNRCHGPTPEAIAKDETRTNSSGHLSRIEAQFSELEGAIQTLERHAQALCNIG